MKRMQRNVPKQKNISLLTESVPSAQNKEMKRTLHMISQKAGEKNDFVQTEKKGERKQNKSHTKYQKKNCFRVPPNNTRN